MSLLPEVSSSAIAAVGAACGLVILLLSGVLAFFCCQRPKPFKELLQTDASAERPVASYSACDGKPYALVPPHPVIGSCDAEVEDVDEQRPSCNEEVRVRREISNEKASGRRRSSGVFATFRTGHSPLSPSSSSPGIFCLVSDCDFGIGDVGHAGGCCDQNGGMRRKIVYEVVV